MVDDLQKRNRQDYGYSLIFTYEQLNLLPFVRSIVNTYLIEQCGLIPNESPLIGLVVSSYCQFFAPVGFPEVLDLGLRVNKLGSSSVTYEVGVFSRGEDQPAAVGGYTHVFVGSESRKSTPMATGMREGLSKLLAPSLKPTAKL
ncbi:thioesterase thiol ester dehydrase-isomerase [Coprinellus micaceus]|uniref:Thioesterase thiol ester dehydrase-isomerase n=1 Tax=Coprinellus micaceus TaxID=71717 RepID=A0A4Y7SMM8_COPMI|nr:thioesterase thiol ester dehydrase-isomerase [Coprinellus micaceus]